MENKPIYISVITRYLEGKSDDFSEIYCLGHKDSVIKLLKKYMEQNPKYQKEVENIITNYNEYTKLHYTRENLKDIIKYIIIKENINYLYDIYLLLFSKEEEALKILKKRNMQDKEFELMFNLFKNRFPNQPDECEYLEKIYNKYKNKMKKKLEKKERSNRYLNVSLTNKSYETHLKIITELYESNLCIEEYCSKTGTTFSSIKEAIKILKNYPEDKLYIDEITKRDNTEFFKNFRAMVYDMAMDEDFDLLTYYENTKLSRHDFNELGQKLINDKVLFKNLQINIRKQDCKITRVSRIEHLQMNTIIAGREILREEKEMIFRYLEENNLSDNLYRVALRRYLDGRLDLGIQKVLK